MNAGRQAASPSIASDAQIGVTEVLARYVHGATFDALPADIQAEAVRAFVNWVGCAFGGSGESAVTTAAAVIAELGSAPQASVIGHKLRTDVANAAFLNCISSAVLAYDDAHLPTVTHPSGGASAALFAMSERYPVSGEKFLAAVAIAIELQCRIANAIVLPPAKFNFSFYATGLGGPVGIALGCGMLLGLDVQKLQWAVGIAATQSAGLRANAGTMTAHFRPAHTARSGVVAALFADKGFTCVDNSLEAKAGFFDVYSVDPVLSRIVDGLGREFEIKRNAYKPYPCGVVIHAALDACLEIRGQFKPGDRLAALTWRTNPLALRLTGIKNPTTTLQSLNSSYHWIAAAMVRGKAGLAESHMDCINDPEVARWREQMEAVADPAIANGEAVVEARLESGRVLRAHVTAQRGTIERPMTDAEIDDKFREQVTPKLGEAKTGKLLALCRSTAKLSDVGREVREVWSA